MKKISPYDLFILALKNRFFAKRRWIQMMMMTPYSNIEPDESTCMCYYRDGSWGIQLEDDVYQIDVAKGRDVVYTIKDPIELPAGTMDNVVADVKTNIGNALFQAIVFNEPFGKKWPFEHKSFDEGDVTKRVAAMLTSEEITAEQYQHMVRNAYFCTLFTQISVVTTSPRSLSPSPEAVKIVDELTKKYAKLGMLTDPATAALIDEQAIKADRKYIADDITRNFLGKKDINVTRKKMYTSVGPDTAPGKPNEVHYTKRSLAEGLRPEDMPAIINSSRVGSAGRAMDTAMGGYAVKISSQIFQNTRIADSDCGTKLGVAYTVTEELAKEFEGLYILGKSESITKDEVKALIGKSITIRHPITCKTIGGNYCAVCMGDKVSAVGDSLGAGMASINSVFMGISMSRFHGRSLELESYDLETAIS